MSKLSSRRHFIVGSAAAALSTAARGDAPTPHDAARGPALPVQPDTSIELWPDVAPGMPDLPPSETIVDRSPDPASRDRAVTGVVRPRIDVFRPQEPNGAAVLIMPGGGYERVVIDKEGHELGRWLAGRGVTAFVLFYRLPGDGWRAGPDVALADAQRATRLIRHHAAEFSLDPERVAALGFSAGGHLCADLATRFATTTYTAVDAADRRTTRPRLAAPIYPVIMMSGPAVHPGSRARLLGTSANAELERRHSPQYNVTSETPPCFLVHAEDDDSVPVDNTLALRSALRMHGIPVETHLFAQGGHGFGLRRAAGKPAAVWPELFLNWLRSNGLVPG